MDFEFSPEERAFAAEVEKFLDENHDPEVMDLTKENFAQLVDTPARRRFMKKLAAKGWLGMTWPKQYGGREMEGVYEYILNEALARRGAPQIGKGVGIIGKTLIRHGSEKLKQEFLPKIINAEGEYQAAEKLAQAANVLAQTPIAVQLRFLQTMREVASERNTTTFFPIPVDLFAPFLKSLEGAGAPKP